MKLTIRQYAIGIVVFIALISVTVLHYKWSNMQEELADYDVRMQRVEEDKRSMEASVREHQKRNKKLNDMVKSLKAQLSLAESVKVEKEATGTTQQAELAAANFKVSQLEKEAEAHQVELESLRTRLVEAEEKLAKALEKAEKATEDQSANKHTTTTTTTNDKSDASSAAVEEGAEEKAEEEAVEAELKEEKEAAASGSNTNAKTDEAKQEAEEAAEEEAEEAAEEEKVSQEESKAEEEVADADASQEARVEDTSDLTTEEVEKKILDVATTVEEAAEEAEANEDQADADAAAADPKAVEKDLSAAAADVAVADRGDKLLKGIVTDASANGHMVAPGVLQKAQEASKASARVKRDLMLQKRGLKPFMKESHAAQKEPLEGAKVTKSRTNRLFNRSIKKDLVNVQEKLIEAEKAEKEAERDAAEGKKEEAEAAADHAKRLVKQAKRDAVADQKLAQKHHLSTRLRSSIQKAEDKLAAVEAKADAVKEVVVGTKQKEQEAVEASIEASPFEED